MPILYNEHWHLGLLDARQPDRIKVSRWDPLGDWCSTAPGEDGLAGCMYQTGRHAFADPELQLAAPEPLPPLASSYQQKPGTQDCGICVAMMALKVLSMAGDGAALPDFNGDVTAARAWMAASIIEGRLLLP